MMSPFLPVPITNLYVYVAQSCYLAYTYMSLYSHKITKIVHITHISSAILLFHFYCMYVCMYNIV